MRTWDEIAKNKRFCKSMVMVDPMDRKRFIGKGYLKVGPGKWDIATVIFGSYEDGEYPEHVSMSFPDRDPTWSEMCVLKDVFWEDEEECYQIHPKKSEYVNIHEHCLHIWSRKH